MTYIITKEDEAITIKQFISKHTRITQKQLTRLKKLDNGILLNDQRVTVRATLKENDILTLNTEIETKTSDKIKPIDLPMSIIYEDDHYIAFNKEAGMPTHPSHDHYEDTLANALAFLYQKRECQFVFRAVNRLDKDTSGIVVCAKSAEAATAFSILQQENSITKKYIALTKGKLTGSGSIKGYMRRKANSVMLREFSKEKRYDDDMFSHTDYKCIESSDTHTLVELELHTGRTHQIRVHLSSIGHPIVGDGLYGNEENYTRHFLHASSIRFVHPFTEKEIFLTVEPPKEFIDLINNKGILYERCDK